MTIERSDILFGFLPIKKKPLHPGETFVLHGPTIYRDNNTVDPRSKRWLTVIDPGTVTVTGYSGMTLNFQASEAAHKRLYNMAEQSKKLVKEEINAANLTVVPDSPFQRLLDRVTGHSVRYTWTPR